MLATRAIPAIAASAICWLLGHCLMHIGLAHALRAGQLEDLEIYLRTRGINKLVADDLLDAMCKLKRTSAVTQIVEGLSIPLKVIAGSGTADSAGQKDDPKKA